MQPRKLHSYICRDLKNRVSDFRCFVYFFFFFFFYFRRILFRFYCLYSLRYMLSLENKDIIINNITKTRLFKYIEHFTTKKGEVFIH